MRRDRIVLTMMLAGCPAADDAGSDSGAAATDTGVAATDTGVDDGATTDPCAGVDLPLCDYCPDQMAVLCGLPCDSEGQSCSNDIGDGMTCQGGVWECAVHPPLGMGCNLVCVGAGACTEIGCNDGLTIALGPDDDGVTAGSYAITIVLDGASQMCTLDVGTDAAACPGSAPCVIDTTCNALTVFDPDGVFSLLVELAADVTVTVQRDGGAPVEVVAQPVYSISAPNGSGCEPACTFGTVEVAAL